MNGMDWSGKAVEKVAIIRKRRRRLNDRDCLELRGEVFAELFYGPHEVDANTIARTFGKSEDTILRDIRAYESRKRAEKAGEG